MKGNSTAAYQVDGISGGTITSDGVELMILDCLQAYFPFLETYAGATASAQLHKLIAGKLRNIMAEVLEKKLLKRSRLQNQRILFSAKNKKLLSGPL